MYPEDTNTQHPRRAIRSSLSHVLSYQGSTSIPQAAVTYLGKLPNHRKGKRQTPEEARHIGLSRPKSSPTISTKSPNIIPKKGQ
ncbi:MAG: hypothetical protein ACETWM_04265 [Candidatus Lokiarchaeia archaeon]